MQHELENHVTSARPRKLTLWLPRTLFAPRRGTPRLAMSSVVPGCVPGGIFSSTGPSTVVTLTCEQHTSAGVQC
jgi:hypothetical protein